MFPVQYSRAWTLATETNFLMYNMFISAVGLGITAWALIGILEPQLPVRRTAMQNRCRASNLRLQDCGLIIMIITQPC